MNTEYRKGFRIDYEPSQHVLALRFLGLWDAELARRCDRQFHERVCDLQAAVGSWYLILDFSRCVPMPDDVLRIVWRSVEFAKQHGMRNKAIIANGTIVGFQPMSSSGDAGMNIDFYFQSEADAVRWLLDEPEHRAQPGL